MKFRPLHDRVLIRRVEQEAKTMGGIIIPDTAQEKPMEGDIIAVGPGTRGEDGTVHPLDIKAGDRVLFGKWSGTELRLDGEELMIMKESDIMGVVDMAVDAVVKDIQKRSKKVSTNDEIAQVGTISANGDTEIGRMLAEAMKKVGNEGVITVEEAKSLETELDVVEGMQFDRGYLSPYFITNADKMIAELDSPYILLFEKKLSGLQAMLPVLESVVLSG